MHALNVRVENGRYIIDEKAELPDGTELYLVPANEKDDNFSELDKEEVKAMEASIHEGLADIESGRTFDTAKVIAEIRSGA